VNGSIGGELRYGYTFAEITRLANAAVWRDVWHQSLPLPERQDIAWLAIAEHLYACDREPQPDELVRAAWTALRAETEAEWHTHGVSRQGSIFDGDQTMTGFARYWYGPGKNTPGSRSARSGMPCPSSTGSCSPPWP